MLPAHLCKSTQVCRPDTRRNWHVLGKKHFQKCGNLDLVLDTVSAWGGGATPSCSVRGWQRPTRKRRPKSRASHVAVPPHGSGCSSLANFSSQTFTLLIRWRPSEQSPRHLACLGFVSQVTTYHSPNMVWSYFQVTQLLKGRLLPRSRPPNSSCEGQAGHVSHTHRPGASHRASSGLSPSRAAPGQRETGVAS